MFSDTFSGELGLVGNFFEGGDVVGGCGVAGLRSAWRGPVRRQDPLASPLVEFERALRLMPEASMLVVRSDVARV